MISWIFILKIMFIIVSMSCVGCLAYSFYNRKSCKTLESIGLIYTCIFLGIIILMGIALLCGG